MMRFIERDGKNKANKWAAVILLALLVLAVCVLTGTRTAHASFTGIIRVRISPSNHSSDIRVIPHGKYFIAQAKSVQLLDVEYKVHRSGSNVQLKHGGTVLYSGPKLTLTRAAGNTEENFIVFPYSPTHKTRTNYYGNIEFSVNSGLCAVNHVYVEDYVMGVAPYEMSPSWPAQALRAQAVCARNYGVRAALASPSGTWHLGDTASSQVYKGVPGVSSSETIDYTAYNRVKSAVEGTSRKVMKYDGAVFSAYYSAWNGGETLNVRGWTGNTLPDYGYTTVKKDPYDDKRCKDAYWISRTVNRYLKSSGDDINKAVQDMLIRKYKAQYDKASSAVTFKSTSTGIRGKDPSGASEVSIVYENFKCLAKFKVGDKTEEEWVTFTDTDLKSALSISSPYCAFRIANRSDGTTTLYNVRYGHGVGMSQRGAQQMANEGMGHTDILRFYYKDITFSTLSVSPPSLPSLPSGAAPAAKSASYNSVRLTWKAVPGADGYRIYRKTSSTSYKVVKDSLASTAYTNGGLSTGTTYYYKVRPYTLRGSTRVYGKLTKAVSVRPVPAVPTDFKAVSASYNSVRLTWKAVTGADGYRIYRKTSSTSYRVVKDGLASTSYKNGGLGTGTTYYYKVRPYTLRGSTRVYGKLTKAASVRPVPAAPTDFKAVSASYNSVRLTWKAVTGADGYRIYRKTSSTSYKVVKDALTSTSYKNGGLSTGTTYYYKVRPYTLRGSTRVYGKLTKAASVRPVPAAPTDFKAVSASYNSVRLTYKAVTGADGYRIYRKTTSTSYRVVKDGLASTAYKNGGLSTGTTYYYKVRPYTLRGSTRVYGSVTKAASVRPVPAAPTDFKAVPASYNSARLTWKAVPGADGYRIYRKTSSTSYKIVKDSLTSTGYKNGGLSTGTTYYYKVRPYTLRGSTRVYGKLTKAASVRPVPAAPTDFKAVSASYNSVRLTYKAVTGADGYRVYRKTSSTSYKVVKDALASTGYKNGGLSTGTTYYYKVRPYTLRGSTRIYGKLTKAASVRPVPAAPASVAAVRTGSTRVKISWTAVAGAGGYDVYRKPSGGSYSRICSTADLVFTDEAVEAGASYYYRVRSYRMADTAKVAGPLSAPVFVP